MDNTILVVEDDPELQEVLTLNLQSAGYRVLRASNIRQAEALLNANLPQMVLLDWMLPDTPGLTFARRLRSEGRTLGVPIIMLTGRDCESDKITGLEAGVDDYLIKPFSPRELLARIKAVMRRCAPQHTDMVVEMVQRRTIDVHGGSLGSFPLRGGATLIVSRPTVDEQEDPKAGAPIRYVIGKHLHGPEGKRREERQLRYAQRLGLLAGTDPRRFQIDFAMLHGGL